MRGPDRRDLPRVRLDTRRRGHPCRALQHARELPRRQPRAVVPPPAEPQRAGARCRAGQLLREKPRGGVPARLRRRLRRRPLPRAAAAGGGLSGPLPVEQPEAEDHGSRQGMEGRPLLDRGDGPLRGVPRGALRRVRGRLRQAPAEEVEGREQPLLAPGPLRARRLPQECHLPGLGALPRPRPPRGPRHARGGPTGQGGRRRLRRGVGALDAEP
mmetsp:Transcript_70206/g.205859  ORF Transcript_70206/g.205859 Transcript_70206/m.205859 type:complete len:214 (-) Transcript_70206:577-1218(-)